MSRRARRVSSIELRWWAAEVTPDGENGPRTPRPPSEPLYMFLRGARVRCRIVGLDVLIDGESLAGRLNALCRSPCYDADGMWNMIPLLEGWTTSRRGWYRAEVRRWLAEQSS